MKNLLPDYNKKPKFKVYELKKDELANIFSTMTEQQTGISVEFEIKMIPLDLDETCTHDEWYVEIKNPECIPEKDYVTLLQYGLHEAKPFLNRDTLLQNLTGVENSHFEQPEIDEDLLYLYVPYQQS